MLPKILELILGCAKKVRTLPCQLYYTNVSKLGIKSGQFRKMTKDMDVDLRVSNGHLFSESPTHLTLILVGGGGNFTPYIGFPLVTQKQ